MHQQSLEESSHHKSQESIVLNSSEISPPRFLYPLIANLKQSVNIVQNPILLITVVHTLILSQDIMALDRQNCTLIVLEVIILFHLVPTQVVVRSVDNATIQPCFGGEMLLTMTQKWESVPVRGVSSLWELMMRILRSMTILSNSNKQPQYTSALPTAILDLVRKKSQIKCKSLFDLGSQKNFILSSLAKLLDLKPILQTTLTVDSFDSSGSSRVYDLVTVNVQCNSELISVTAVVVESTPSRMSMVGRGSFVKGLSQTGISLADPTIDSDIYAIGFLICVGNYFKFVFAYRFDNELYGIPSKVGMLLAGRIPIHNSLNTRAVTVQY